MPQGTFINNMNKLLLTIKYGSAKTKAFMALLFVLVVGGLAALIYGIAAYSFVWLAIGTAALIIGAILLATIRLTDEEINPEHKKDKSGEAGKEADSPTKRKRDEAFGQAAEKSDKVPGQMAEKRDKVPGQAAEKADKASERERESASETPARKKRGLFKRKLQQYLYKCLPIMIDSWDKKELEHVPALCWTRKDKVNIRIIEEQDRMFSMSLSSFLNVTYRHNVPIKDPEAYDVYRDNPELMKKFSEVMPTFTTTRNRMGIEQYSMNLYVLGNELAITPLSFKMLKSKYLFNIKIFESLKLEGDYSKYFKKAYEIRTMWTDGVIGSNEYQNRIRMVLESMVEAEDLNKFDFGDDLEKMVEHRLITDEYANYYMGQRRSREAAETARRKK